MLFYVQPGQSTFILGAEEAKECSDDDDDDVVVGRVDKNRKISTEAFLPNVGIVMSNTNINVPEDKKKFPPNITDMSLNQVVQKDVNIKKYPLQHSSTEVEINTSKIPQKSPTTNPGIVIEKSKPEPPKNLPLEKTNQQQLSTNDGLDKSRKFSHSSGEVDLNDKERKTDGLTVDDERRNSEKNLSLGISSSQSENTLKSFTNVLTSPSAVLSPFSKLAKGVQSFGANLDPRKVVEKVGSKQAVLLDHIAAENAKLEEKWKDSKCKSRLIAV